MKISGMINALYESQDAHISSPARKVQESNGSPHSEARIVIEMTTFNNAEYPHVSLEDISKFVDEMAGCERKLRRKEKEVWDELSTEDKEVISMRLIRGQTMKVGVPLTQRGAGRD